MKKRIWELDAFRGLCVLGMVAVHFVYDLVYLYRLVSWRVPAWFTFVQQWGGLLFLLLSGICVTLGRHSIKRGLLVFACGMLCTLATGLMAAFGLANKSVLIYFGVLHCLGCCMLLWQIFKKLPWWALLILGGALMALGFWLDTLPPVESNWLFPIGLVPRGFTSSDYFPLFPNFGYFLVGAAIGKTAYGKKQSLLPDLEGKSAIFRGLQWCGTHSLWIYLLHQPILSGIFYLISLLK